MKCAADDLVWFFLTTADDDISCQSWKCPRCGFDNSPHISHCSYCCYKISINSESSTYSFTLNLLVVFHFFLKKKYWHNLASIIVESRLVFLCATAATAVVHFNHRNSVCLSVRPSVTWVDQSTRNLS